MEKKVTDEVSNGWTALRFLCRHYNRDNLIEVAKMLTENGVDVTVTDGDGRNALHLVCEFYPHDNLI